MKNYSDIINMPRPVSKHPKMDVANRAKQFMPMDALRGFSLAILTKQAEREFVTRISLTEDAQEQLDRRLHMVRPGDTVSVTFFRLEKVLGDLEVGTYHAETGVIEDIDLQGGAVVLPQAFVPISEIIDIRSNAFDTEYSDPEVEEYAEPDQTQTECGGKRRP